MGDGEESWVTEKIEDAKEAAQAIVAAIPGPRIGTSGIPWMFVLPAAYLGGTLVGAIIKIILKLNSPRAKRQRQVNKNAGLMETLDEVLAAPEGGFGAITPAQFKATASKFGFGGDEILRKYLRYALNEKPFGPELVASLISVRKASQIPDEGIADVLNEISRRTVKAKGPVVMNTSGFTEKGLQRKAAVQALFTKLLYLSELEEFCSQSVREKLEVKSIFGVTDDDADSIRITSLSSAEDMEKLDKAMNLGSETEGGASSSRED